MNEKSKNEADKHGFQWDLRVLQLPKLVEADPRGKDLLNRLATHALPLWPGGKVMVPAVSLTPALSDVLRTARSSGRLVRSLEGAESKLAAESRGLGLADKKERGLARRACFALTRAGK